MANMLPELRDEDVEQMARDIDDSSYLWTYNNGVNLADSIIPYDDLQGTDYGDGDVSDAWLISDNEISTPCVETGLCGDWSPEMSDRTLWACVQNTEDDTMTLKSDMSDNSLLGHVCEIEDDPLDDTRSVKSDMSDNSLLGLVENIEAGMESFAMSPRYWIVPEGFELDWSLDSESLAILDEFTALSNDLMRCDSLEAP